MIRLTFFEFLKVWRNKFFLSAMVTFILLNVLTLWYTNTSDPSAPPASAYRLLGSEIRILPADEKTMYINVLYEKITAFAFIDEIKSLEAYQTEYADDMIAQQKSENEGIYEKYIEDYNIGNLAKYTDNLDSELKFITEIKNELTKVNGFTAYLEEIDNKANLLSGIGIFKGINDLSSFSSRNILKTQKDYQQMKNTKIDYILSKGFVTATDFAITDVIVILLTLILASVLIFEEKEKGLFKLTKATPNGKGKLITAKITSLGINIAVMTIVLFAVNLLCCSVIFGIDGLTRSLQSVSVFTGSTLQVSLWQYFIIFLCTKWLAYFAVALLIVLISIHAKHSSVTYIAFAGIFLISAVIFLLIPSASNLNWFKYVNLISFVRTNGLYQQYFNLDLLGNPVTIVSASLTIIVILSLLLSASVIVSFCRKRDLIGGISPFKKITQNMNFIRYRPDASLLSHEAYKLFRVNKAGIFLLLFMILQFFSYQSSADYISPDEYHYKNYMSILKGELTSEKITFIEAEQKKFGDANSSIDAITKLVETGEISETQADAYKQPYSKILEPAKAFERITDHYTYIKENPGAHFVYDTGYKKLFGITPNEDTFAALKLALLCILCFCSAFPIEYKKGMINVISVTPRGRKDTAKYKLLLSATCLFPLLIASVLPGFLSLQQQYGFSELTSSITSLQAFSFMPGWLSIAAAMVLLFVVKILASAFIMVMILAVSIKLKGTTHTILAATFLFVFPIVLTMIGVHSAQWVSVLPLFNPFSLLISTNNLMPGIILVIITIFLVTGGCFYISTRFCKARN